MKNRFHIPTTLWLAALGALASMAACGDTKASFNEAGGSGGASGWTYVPPGTTPSGTGGTLGSAGSSNGGSLGLAGSAGSAGGSMLPPLTFKCGGKQPDQPLITRFDGFMADRWMSPGNLDGGVYVYPDTLKPTAGDFLRFADQVKDYTGMGVWFAGCIDAAKFRGVRFTIAGSVGASEMVQFLVISNRDKEVVERDSIGECVPADPSSVWQTCHPPAVMLPVNSQPTTYSIPWSAFSGGLPTPTTDGSDVIALQWSFDWAAGTVPYAAELTVDNLEFFTGEDGARGAGGAGDAGGASSTTAATGGAPDAAGAGGQAAL